MLLTAILFYGSLHAQNDTIPVADNLVSTGIPPLPASIVSDVLPYTNYRRAFMVNWHPEKKEMLITTRFANTYQLHWVKMLCQLYAAQNQELIEPTDWQIRN